MPHMWSGLQGSDRLVKSAQCSLRQMNVFSKWQQCQNMPKYSVIFDFEGRTWNYYINVFFICLSALRPSKSPSLHILYIILSVSLSALTWVQGFHKAYYVNATINMTIQQCKHIHPVVLGAVKIILISWTIRGAVVWDLLRRGNESARPEYKSLYFGPRFLPRETLLIGGLHLSLFISDSWSARVI